MVQRRASVPRMTAAAACAAVLAVTAGCGLFSKGAQQTVTQTVTVTPSTSPADTVTGSPGAPVTVVAPPALSTSSEAVTTPSTDTSAPEDTDTSSSESPETTVTTQTTATTTDRAARIVTRKLATSCANVLSRNNITRVLGSSAISADSLRVTEDGNPANQMTARSKCYYGTSDLAVARPLVVALAGFASEDAAAEQITVTTASEKDNGAKASVTKANGASVQILLRDGGFAITQSGAMTVSISIAHGIIPDARLATALTSLMSAVLDHLG